MLIVNSDIYRKDSYRVTRIWIIIHLQTKHICTYFALNLDNTIKGNEFLLELNGKEFVDLYTKKTYNRYDVLQKVVMTIKYKELNNQRHNCKIELEPKGESSFCLQDNGLNHEFDNIEYIKFLIKEKGFRRWKKI